MWSCRIWGTIQFKVMTKPTHRVSREYLKTPFLWLFWQIPPKAAPSLERYNLLINGIFLFWLYFETIISQFLKKLPYFIKFVSIWITRIWCIAIISKRQEFLDDLKSISAHYNSPLFVACFHFPVHMKPWHLYNAHA